ncbi:MAG: ATP-binding protein [Desulfurococcales archaeon]|nr:ATP-binding protein [Desulfurococcales archaeon]
MVENEQYVNTSQRQGIIDLQRVLEERTRRAVEEALKYGSIVGYVSRYSPVEVDMSNAVITFDIDPSIYFSRLNDPSNPLYRMGSVLAVIDPKTQHLVSVRIKEIHRLDELASLGVEEPLSTPLNPDTSTLMTRTKIIGEILLEYDPVKDKTYPSNLSIEPQSPVIDPRPNVLVKLLGLPGYGEGVVLGSLSFNSILVKNGGIPVVLPYKVMLQHTLILGTTGSGKTTLVKNMIANTISNQTGRIVVVFDLNQDYIQLLLPPLKHPGQGMESQVYHGVYKDTREPDNILIIAPISREIVGRNLDSVYNDLHGGIFEEYFEDSYKPLLTLLGHEIVQGKIEERNHTINYVFKLNERTKRIVFIPYSLYTTRIPGDTLVNLMPGLTGQARNILRRLKRKVESELPIGSPLPFLDLYVESIRVYLEDTRKKDDPCASRSQETWFTKRVLENIAAKLSGDYIALEDDMDLLLSNYYHIPIIICHALQEITPHRSSLENLLRELGTLLDTGIVDVITGVHKGKLEFQAEPDWMQLLDMAIELNAPIIVDLAWSYRASSLGENTHRVTAIRLLSTLLTWKHKMWKERKPTPDIHVYIDEAHQFFPNETKDENTRQLSGVLSRIARLGRARGIGLVFATHTPSDLNDIIIQLTNTKIILRMDPGRLERLDIPADTRRHLALAPPRYYAVKSYYIPNGFITGVTTTPMTLHYDTSA